MRTMIDYIFCSLQEFDNIIRSFRKTLRKQARFNRMLILFAMVTTTYAITAEIRNCENEKKIEDFRNEIKEFKRMKGE
ncbi:hypothetical protein FACS1894171_1900 [Clostridia bacterium]|nr:hypothetical protein FACS1894171_1900 [Clostridia bacterium]